MSDIICLEEIHVSVFKNMSKRKGRERGERERERETEKHTLVAGAANLSGEDGGERELSAPAEAKTQGVDPDLPVLVAHRTQH